MTLTYPSDELNFVDLQKDFATSTWGSLRQDLLAGLNVALLTLPQAMASAMLAGLPLICGLLAAAYSCLISALSGSSRQLVVGPTNATAILIQLGTVQIMDVSYRGLDNPAERTLLAVQILTQLTFLVGALQILAAWWRLGRLTQFVSHSVITGYLLGTAIAVIVNQTFPFIGLPTMSGGHSVYENIVYLLTHLSEIQGITITIGLGSLLLFLMLQKTNSKIPMSLITLVVASGIVELFGLSSYSGGSLTLPWFTDNHLMQNVQVVGDAGELYGLIPEVALPFFNMRIINGVLPVACAIALLSLIDTVSVAKSLAAITGQRLAINQEIFGLGLGNLTSSLISGMPVSGSPSRSGLNIVSGAQTRFAAVFNACFVCLFVWMLGFFVTRIPLAALAALVIVTVMSVVNTKHVWFCTRATPSDAFVLWTTLLACLFFSLDIAFYIGVGLSIILYLKKSATPHLVEYEMDEYGDLRPLDLSAQHQPRPIRVIKVEGELFFGAADLFQTTLKTIATDDTTTRVIILQLKNARDMDATTCLALQQLYEYLCSTGRHLLACGITSEVWDVLENSDLVTLIGEENLFAFDSRWPLQHMQQAFKRALQIVAEPLAQPAPTEEPEPQILTLGLQSLEDGKSPAGPS